MAIDSNRSRHGYRDRGIDTADAKRARGTHGKPYRQYSGGMVGLPRFDPARTLSATIALEVIMSMYGLIIAMAIAVYALRITGFLLATVSLPSAWEQVLGFVPVATLTALVVAHLSSSADDRSSRLVAVVCAGIAGRYTGRVWVCIVVGLSIHGLLNLFTIPTGSW